MSCKICGADDLFTSVSGEPACAICRINFIGGLPATPQRVAEVRARLGLEPGQFLKQDSAAEAARILGRPRP